MMNITSVDAVNIAEHPSAVTVPQFVSPVEPGGRGDLNTGALVRGSIVFSLVCLVVIVYIVLRTCRLRRNRKLARYNMLSTADDEADLLHSGDEETVFQAGT